jgi:hypothetical protein
MRHIRRLISLFFAIVMTALTFSAISQSVGAAPDIHGKPIAAHVVSEHVNSTTVTLRGVLARLVQKG